MAMADIGARPPLASLPNAQRPSVRRSRSNRVIGGVAAGIAVHLGTDVRVVRIVFVALSLAAGFGIVVYLLLWLLAPSEASETRSTPRRLPRPSPQQLLGIALVLAGVLILLWIIGLSFGWELGWPFTLAAIGFAILWARSGNEEGRGRFDLRTFGSPFEAAMRGQASFPRVAVGSVLILGGLGVFLAATTSLSAAANVVLAVMVTVGGLALLAGPWFWRVASELMEERNSRIRSEARAELAAHLHDSVLQTLALIQPSQEPREMASLARTQERELRAWLYGRAPSVHGTTLRDAIDEMADRIERGNGIRIEAIVVGDLELDEGLSALVAACAEATLNAAKHSGADEVSVYVEVEVPAVSAFVRDQGRGFEPGSVPEDRRGIADSIVRRMERHGGSAEIRAQPGHGTEVILRLPRLEP